MATLLLLAREKGPSVGLSKNNLLRLTLYFVVILFLDVLRYFVSGPVPVYLSIFAAGILFFAFGHIAAVIHYCPEAKSLRESIQAIFRQRSLSYRIFNLVVLVWLAVSFLSPFELVTRTYEPDNVYVSVLFPGWYSLLATLLLAPMIVYPGLLLAFSIRQARSAGVKRSLWLLLAGWLFLATPQSAFYVSGSTMPFASESGLVIGSVFFVLASLAMQVPSGIIRTLTSQLSPQPIIEAGRKYLVLHDGGKQVFSFLSTMLQNIIETGGKIVVKSPSSPWLTDGLSQPKFTNWLKTGRIVRSAYDENIAVRETFSDLTGPAGTPLTYIRELDTGDLHKTLILATSAATTAQSSNDKRQLTQSSEVFLLESRKAPRPLLAEFLRKNSEVEVMNLSETKDSFSNTIGWNHQHLQGVKVLLEYDSNTSYEEMVDRFFTEATSNAEYCALFTTKSSKLYRGSKGRKTVRLIAASSLVSSLEETPDGEIQIPDRELGLVTSIVSEMFENNKTANVSLVFDSLTDLMISDHWEQAYSGIKQLFEMVSVPHVTALFLANKGTMDPKLLAAIRSFFSTQLRLEGSGLQTIKLSP